MSDGFPGSVKNTSGGMTATHPPVHSSSVSAAPTSAKDANTLRTPFVAIACWRLEDLRFEFGSSFIKPEAAEEFADLVELVQQHPEAPLSIFGHADPVGLDENNKKLSGRRAGCVYGMLTRRPEIWEDIYSQTGEFTAPDETDKWGTRVIQFILEDLGHAPGPVNGHPSDQTKQAVKKFQEDQGLVVDGQPGKETRQKLFLAYMDKHCRDGKGNPFKLTPGAFLARGKDKYGKGDYQGCGEFNPKMLFSQKEQQKFQKPEYKEERDKENAVNRRVLLLLFRRGSRVKPDVWPCPRAKEGPAGCKRRFWSDGEERRSRRLPDKRRRYEKTWDTFGCRFYDRFSGSSPCESPALPVLPSGVFTVASLQASLQSTKNAATGARPAPGTFKTANRALDFAAPANDLMVVMLNAGEIVVQAQNVNPPSEAKRVRWQIERDPSDTVAADTPGLDRQTGEQVKVTPNTPGTFRLICYRDANGNGKHDSGEELRVLRMVIVRITPQPGARLTTNSVFAGAVNSVSTGSGGKRPMRLQADFLLEGGGGDRRFGLDQVVLGNIGNLLDDTFVVNYPARHRPNDTRNGTETEDPDFQTNPAPGFPTPMVDSVNVAQGHEPTGGTSPFRGNSVETIQGNGPGGNGQIRRIASLDAPAFGWHGNHPTTRNPWATTQGVNAFREWITAHTKTFERNYTALGRGDWTVDVIGTRGAGGRWTDNGSSVDLSAAWTTAGFPQTGDAAGVQVLGRSFVREFGMIVNP